MFNIYEVILLVEYKLKLTLLKNNTYKKKFKFLLI